MRRPAGDEAAGARWDGPTCESLDSKRLAMRPADAGGDEKFGRSRACGDRPLRAG